MNTKIELKSAIIGGVAVLLILGIGFGFAKLTDRHDYKKYRGGMSEQMRSMTGSLEGKTGGAFDEVFLAQMIMHHEGAVEMSKQVLVSTARPELLKLAKEIIAAQEAEIDMMKSWQTAWFPNSTSSTDMMMHDRPYHR